MIESSCEHDIATAFFWPSAHTRIFAYANGERIVSDECRACCGAAPCRERRTLFKAILGLVIALPFANVAIAQGANPAKARPREGDQFVFASGDRQEELITPAELMAGGPPILVYPMEPQAKVIRNGSRLNQVVLVRLDPDELAEDTRSYAADGIVGYSAFCTHRGCPVIGWEAQTRMLKCPCHDSQFDPKNRGRVVGGPAKRRIAVLPLKIVDGVLLAAGGFKGRVGLKRG